MHRLLLLTCLALALPALPACDGTFRDLIEGNCDEDSLLCDPLTQRVGVTIPIELPIRLVDFDNLPEFEVGRVVEFNFPPLYLGTGPISEAYDRLPEAVRDRVRSIEIAAVTLIVEDNTLEVPLRPVDFRVGPRAERLLDRFIATGWFDDAVPVALGVEVAPGFNGEYDVPLLVDNIDVVSGIVSDFDFAMGLQLGTRTDIGVVPQGSAGIKVRLDLRFRLRAL